MRAWIWFIACLMNESMTLVYSMLDESMDLVYSMLDEWEHDSGVSGQGVWLCGGDGGGWGAAGRRGSLCKYVLMLTSVSGDQKALSEVSSVLSVCVSVTASPCHRCHRHKITRLSGRRPGSEHGRDGRLLPHTTGQYIPRSIITV